VPTSNGSVASARPTFNVGGQDNPDLASGLLNLLIAEDAAGLYRCEATFANWGPVNGSIGFLYFDRQTLDFGKAFKVQYQSGTLFDGRVMGLEAHFPEGRPPELTVLAEDRFQDLRMTRRTRVFENVSDSDIVSQIAGDHGLTPDSQLQGPTHKVVAQVNQSDLAFLRDRARGVDGEVWVDGSTLHAKARTARTGGSALSMTYAQELRSFSVLADLAQQRTGLTVSGWDVAAKQGLTYQASSSVVSGELNGDQDGSSVLQSALGDRQEMVVHSVPLTSDEARARAESLFKSSARRFVVGRGVARPDPGLSVGVNVRLVGLGPLFSGTYYVAELKHLFDGASGLRTEVTVERPGLGRGP
jgi:Bacteriophage probable baseplate hub protein